MAEVVALYRLAQQNRCPHQAQQQARYKQDLKRNRTFLMAAFFLIKWHCYRLLSRTRQTPLKISKSLLHLVSTALHTVTTGAYLLHFNTYYLLAFETAPQFTLFGGNEVLFF